VKRANLQKLGSGGAGGKVLGEGKLEKVIEIL